MPAPALRCLVTAPPSHPAPPPPPRPRVRARRGRGTGRRDRPRRRARARQRGAAAARAVRREARSAAVVARHCSRPQDRRGAVPRRAATPGAPWSRADATGGVRREIIDVDRARRRVALAAPGAPPPPSAPPPARRPPPAPRPPGAARTGSDDGPQRRREALDAGAASLSEAARLTGARCLFPAFREEAKNKKRSV